MNCEMCGKEGPGRPTLLEGTTLQLCEKCGKYGKVLAAPTTFTKPSQKHQAPLVILAPTFDVVPDYAERIRKARERLGLTQQEFALKLNEKESLLHKLETGTYEPPLELARKLERLLHITLVQETKEEPAATSTRTSGGMTIGDIVKR